MSKPINFNLVLNNTTITNVEDLQKNFSIDEMLWYFHNGLLKKWLAVRGLDNYLNSLNEIKSYNNKDITFGLIKIFDINIPESKVNEELEIINNTERRILMLEEYKKINYNTKKIISDYHAGYYDLVNDIVKNSDDISKINALVKILDENYMECFKLNYRELYYTLIDKAPLAVFIIIENSKMRKYFVADEGSTKDVKEIYNNLKKIVSDRSVLQERLGSNFAEIDGLIKNI